MDREEKDAFYIVRKGDIIGVYRSLSECEEQGGSCVSEPGMSVYKGYGFPKEAHDFLSSFGIKNPLFSVNADFIKDDLFGKLIPCPLQQPSECTLDKPSPSNSKRPQDNGSYECGVLSPRKHLRIDNGLVNSSKEDSCSIEFDGASKGNPGKAGAGAVLRASSGLLFYLREGIGIATNNVAEYRALILGMKFALKKGFRDVRIQGDSMLVCMQVQDKWKTKHPKMAELCKQAKDLKRQFKSFDIQHVDRELNGEADTQANYAIHLAEGQTEEIAGG